MKIAIMGFGVVGSGVGELVLKNRELLSEKCGETIEIAHILDLRDFPDSEFSCFTKEFNDILSDPQVGLVVETMGGINPAYKFTKELLLSGKHVITSNKELVATHGTELLKIAKEMNVTYLFEASVGGGIPIIRPICTSLTAGAVTDIFGILNGTTNYILTQMFQQGESFEDALREAQKKGYAESDPTADIEGFDTCRKTAILGALAYGKMLDSAEIQTEGITKITHEDVEYAEKMGYAIKLIGQTSKTSDGIYASVFPAFIPYSSPLAGVNDVFNGIVVRGAELGDVMFYGRGAGMLPTASAVVSDVVDAIKHKAISISPLWQDCDKKDYRDGKSLKNSYYIRVSGKLKEMSDGFMAVTLKENTSEYAIITPKLSETELEAVLNEINAGGCSVIRKMKVVD